MKFVAENGDFKQALGNEKMKEGERMKKAGRFLLVFVASLLLSGCSFDPGMFMDASKFKGVVRSSDSGKNWEIKNDSKTKNGLASVNLISIAIDPIDSNIVYVGSENNGLYVTKNKGDLWELSSLNSGRVYSIAVSGGKDGRIIYVAFASGNKGKILKSHDDGKTWDDVYFEPNNGTLVTALAVDPANPNFVYAGDSKGMIFVSTDGANSWKKAYSADGKITQINIDQRNKNNIYFLVYEKDVIITRDRGSNFESLKNRSNSQSGIMPTSLALDSKNAGVFYAGSSSGLFRFSGFGAFSAEIKILNNIANSPIRAVGVNPGNSQEILYNSSQILYRSSDGGGSWSTVEIGNGKAISNIAYDLSDSRNVYVTLKSSN